MTGRGIWLRMLCGSLAALPIGGLADVARGERLAIEHCSRCHVIGDYNLLGGIGSTPSFMAMTSVPDYTDRIRVFYTLRPHPVFARLAGTERASTATAYTPEFELSTTEIDDLLDYVRSLENWRPPARR